MAAAQEHIAELLKLPAEDRARIVEALIESLDDEAEDDDPMTAETRTEIERRLARAEAGETEWVSGDEVIAAARRAILERPRST